MMVEKGYEEDLKTSYFQMDGKGRMSPAALLSILQEAAISHSDCLGYTPSYLMEQEKGWAVINWHIQIHRMPVHPENYHLETWSCRCRKMQAERGFYLYDSRGDRLMEVMSRWVYMDTARRRPANVPESMIEAYGDKQMPAIENEKFQMPAEPEEGTPIQSFVRVTRRDTDTNGHANNVKYLEWAMDDVPDEIYETMEAKDIRIVYRKECRRGDLVELRTYVLERPEGKETRTFLLDEAGKTIAEAVVLWN